MKFDLKKVLDGKAVLRRELSSLPIGEKLRLLDALREREIEIRGATKATRRTSRRDTSTKTKKPLGAK